MENSTNKQTELPYDLAIPCLGLYLKELKMHAHEKSLYMNAHSSIIYNSQKTKNTKCPSSDEWIDKCVTSLQWKIIQQLKGMKYIP